MTIEALLARYGLAALFVGAGLEGETVVVAGGLIAHQGLVPLAGAMIASTLGSFTADQLFFLGGRRFRAHRWVKAITAKPAFARAAGIFERHPTGFILAFRFIYGIRVASPVLIGTTTVPARTFLLLNAVAAAIWGVTFTLIGYLFGHGFERLLGHLKPTRHTLIVGLLVVAAVLLAVQLGRMLWRRQR